jgi:hypothetical protein
MEMNFPLFVRGMCAPNTPAHVHRLKNHRFMADSVQHASRALHGGGKPILGYAMNRIIRFRGLTRIDESCRMDG